MLQLHDATGEADLTVIVAGYLRRDLVRRARAFEGRIDLAINEDQVDRRRVNKLEVWRSAEVLHYMARRGESAPDWHRPRRREMRRFNAEDGGPHF